MQLAFVFKVSTVAFALGLAAPAFAETWKARCQPCTEAPDNKCPAIRGKEYKLNCGAYGNSETGAKCPPGIDKTPDCQHASYCNDKIPETYSVSLFDGQVVNDKATAFQAKRTGKGLKQRALIDITYTPDSGSTTAQQKFILDGDECSADFDGELAVTSVTVTEVVADN